jgi:hypothetical protein
MDRHDRNGRRHASPVVRNPILALPGTARLLQLDPDTRALLRAMLIDLAADARMRAEESWRRHKAPMAAYWKAVSVYAGHLARVLR